MAIMCIHNPVSKPYICRGATKGRISARPAWISSYCGVKGGGDEGGERGEGGGGMEREEEEKKEGEEDFKGEKELCLVPIRYSKGCQAKVYNNTDAVRSTTRPSPPRPCRHQLGMLA